MEDEPKTIASLRLGWAVSELRGRCRPTAPPGAPPARYVRSASALPLGVERSNSESAIGVMSTLKSMADVLGLDPKGISADNKTEFSLLEQARCSTLDIARTNRQLHSTNETQAPSQHLQDQLNEEWDELSKCLYHVDEKFQDGIDTLGEPIFSAYQVGRGLADLYWAVDPNAPDDTITSWGVIFGPARIALINESLARLSITLSSSFTAPAIAAALGAWAKFVQAPTRAMVMETSALRDQVRRFYDVLIGGRAPETYVQPLSLIRQWRTLGRLVRAFGLQLVLLGSGLGLLAWFIVLVASSKPHPLLESLLGVASGLGISTAAIQARLKNASQALVKKLRVVAYSDLVAIDFTVPPVPPPEAGDGAGNAISRRRAQFSARRLVVQGALEHTLPAQVRSGPA